MKKISLLALVFPFYLTSVAQARDGQSNAPFKELPFLLKTGVHFKGCTTEGLPDDQEFTRLHEISDSAQTCIAKNFHYKLVGTFTYKCTRTDYYYIQDTAMGNMMGGNQ